MSKKEFNTYIVMLCLILFLFDFLYLGLIIVGVTLLFNLLEIK